MQHIFKSTGHALALFVAIWCGACGFANAQSTEIVGFGDSLMAGYELPEGDGFPAVLQAALVAAGHNAHVINAGVSGDTTTDGLARLDWSIPDGTNIVVLELGANDALRGIMPEITAQNLDAMIVSLKNRNIKIVLAGMLAPPNMGKEYEAKFNAIFPVLAAKYQLPLIPFFTEGVTGHPDLQLNDKMHPNRNGVDVMVKNALPHVLEVLK